MLFNKQYYLCSLNQNNKVRRTKIHDCVINYTDFSKKKNLKQGKNVLLWSNFAQGKGGCADVMVGVVGLAVHIHEFEGRIFQRSTEKSRVCISFGVKTKY